MTINKIQVEYEEGGYVSLWISLKFIWFMTIYKLQIELVKGRYVSILTGVMAPERFEKWKRVGLHKGFFRGTRIYNNILGTNNHM